MNKVRAAIRARKAAYVARHEAVPGRVVLKPTKTKAEIQDELTIAGIAFPTKATKAELEAMQAEDVS